MRWFSRVVCVVMALALAGCSSVQLAYNNAPFLVQYQLDRYLDLNDEQEELLRAQLYSLQQRHREQVLPVYAATLREWAQSLSVQNVFTAEDVLEKQQILQEAALEFGKMGAAELGPVLTSLTPRQRQRLAARFADSNEEYARNNLQNPKRAQERRRERFTENYQDWLGSLTAQQTALLDQWLLSHPNDPRNWAAERMARQGALLQIIDQAGQFESTEQASAALNRYFESLASYRTASMQSVQDQRKWALANLTAQILNLITPQQRRYLQEQLLSYAADFDALASRASGSR